MASRGMPFTKSALTAFIAAFRMSLMRSANGQRNFATMQVRFGMGLAMSLFGEVEFNTSPSSNDTVTSLLFAQDKFFLSMYKKRLAERLQVGDG